jgi:cellulose binding protein with CBM2 domain
VRRLRILATAGTAVVAVGVSLAVTLPSHAAGGLSATYSRIQEWPGSYFQGQYVIANGTSSAVTSWTLKFTLPAGDQLANWWGANVTQSGTTFTATQLAGSSIPAGGSATMGFLVTEGGGLADPANCTLNGASCSAGGTPSPTVSPSTSPSPSKSPSPSPSPSTSPPPPPPPGSWHPNYLAIGSVYTPYSSVDSFFQTLKTHGKIPNYGYQYLIGSDFSGWGNTATTLVSHSRNLGMIPVLVEYGMNGNIDGADAAYNNMQNASWVAQYFTALKTAAQAASGAAAGTPVGWVVEPDMLGYIQQGHGTQYNNNAANIPAATSAARTAGVLGSADPTFANTLKGLVEEINYVIKKYDASAFVGWQVNEWAVRNPLHDTDTMGITAGRQSIVNVGNQVAGFLSSADIRYKADFVAFDQWGQDYGYLNDPNPAGDIRYLNATHWNNYLLYVKTIRASLNLPAVLWQLAVGHLNSTKTPSPTYWNSSGTFPNLNNSTTGQYEDSSSTFWYGDTFTSSGNNLSFYSANPGADPKVSVSGSTITWGSHIPDAAAAGVVAILFGAGTGTGDEGVPEVPGLTSTGTTDFSYWVTRTQHYLASPVALPG